MNDCEWVLLDTETTGFTPPIFVVEIAAQKMRGWESQGPPFRKLVNQNLEIPAAASCVHGYTREILERDGEPAISVYQSFSEYVGSVPLVSYNLEYDLDEVLHPEWRRIGINPIGTRGFCAMRFAQRLLDPVPAGNCKLQTLRQYFRTPERGAHTALGDVQTVADLFLTVFRLIAERRGLATWEKVAAYASEEWYPSRIPFGKHKGRSVREARENRELRDWLHWLAKSPNSRSAKMGRWYLRQLEEGVEQETIFLGLDESVLNSSAQSQVSVEQGLVIYVHPDLKQLLDLVAAARARLADLEAAYTLEKFKVGALQATLFKKLRIHFERRDQLRLICNCRRKYLETLLHGGEEEAEKVNHDYEEAKAQMDSDYKQTATAIAKKKSLSPDEEAELAKLWKKLVKLYHPDRFGHDPEKLATYERLTRAINQAKDNGDLGTLRHIANDPNGFILRQGWTNLDFRDEDQVAQLRCLFESLEVEIISVLEATNELKESSDYELYQITQKSPDMLDTVVLKQKELVEVETVDLQNQAEQLAKEIEELTGNSPQSIA